MNITSATLRSRRSATVGYQGGVRVRHGLLAVTGALLALSMFGSAGCNAAPDEAFDSTSSASTAPKAGLGGTGVNTPAQAAACGHTYTDDTDPASAYYVPPGNLMSVSPNEVVGVQPVAIQGDGEDVCGFAAARNAIIAAGGAPASDQDMYDRGLRVTEVPFVGSIGVESPNMCAFLAGQMPDAGWVNEVGNVGDGNLKATIFNTIVQGGVITTVISWNEAHWKDWSHHWITIDGIKQEDGKTWYRVRTWDCFVWMSEDYLIERMGKTAYAGRPFCHTTKPDVRPSEVGPAPGFTASTGYSGDGHCCCATGTPKGSIDFQGPWVVMPEHQCLDSNHAFRPGTCGSPDPKARTAAGLPTDDATCAQFNANMMNWRAQNPAGLQIAAKAVATPIAD